MAYAKISELDESKETWVIRVRMCRMWEAINFKSENEIMGLEMIFLDAEGDSIQGYVRKSHIKKFKPMFQESEVYAIRNFKVGRSSVQYKVVPNNQRIYFNITTSVRKVTPVPDQIPPNVFFFASEDTHEDRVRNNTLLTDIVGCVAGVGQVQYVGEAKKKEIELKTNCHEIINVTLWGNISPMFDITPYEGLTEPVIATITSTTIKKFKGKLVYASTTATRIYFNLDIPEVKALTLRFAEGYDGIKMLQHEQVAQVPLAEQVSLNRRNIKQILEMEWVSDIQEHMFTVVGKIVEIDNSYGWCYVSCNQCSKKVVPDNGSFLCTTCNKECSYPILRYKIHVRVADSTATTTFVLFNQEAEKLIKGTASKFMARVGGGNNNLPDEITKLAGKTFVFKIKVTDYNLKDGFENYTVVKIFEEVEVEHKRKAATVIADKEEQFPTQPLASSGIGATTSAQGGLINPVTPEKKAIQTKKIKMDE